MAPRLQKFQKQCAREGCTEMFWTTPFLVSRGGGKYHSTDCYRLDRQGKTRGPYKNSDPRHWEEPGINICLACGKSFPVGGRGNPPRSQQLCDDTCQKRSRYRRGAHCQVLSDTDAAYIAAFIDGEGSIMLTVRSPKTGGGVALSVTIANTNHQILEWMSTTTGLGNIGIIRKESDRHREAYVWRCQSEGAETLLRQIRPYLKIKGTQADIGITTQEQLRDPAKKSDRSWQYQKQAVMKALNARGPQLTLVPVEHPVPATDPLGLAQAGGVLLDRTVFRLVSEEVAT